MSENPSYYHLTPEGCDDSRQVLERLVPLRTGKGVSQRWIARQMGTTQSAVSDMEKGNVDARLSTIIRYTGALGFRMIISLVHLDDGRRELVWPAAPRQPFTRGRVDYSAIAPVRAVQPPRVATTDEPIAHWQWAAYQPPPLPSKPGGYFLSPIRVRRSEEADAYTQSLVALHAAIAQGTS